MKAGEPHNVSYCGCYFFIAESHHPCLGGGMQSMSCRQGTWAPGDLAVAVIPDSVPGAGCLNEGGMPEGVGTHTLHRGSKRVALGTPNSKT